ncbi:hypothetical protein Aduo_008865 [Ancylostoma duodenale]
MSKAFYCQKSHYQLLKMDIFFLNRRNANALEMPSETGVFLTPAAENPYVFLNWWNIDIFCYFSHNFVTIPPTGYTNVAHDHGCLVLGTFITEWKGGAKLCERFLASEDSVRRTAQSLVAIARHYNFDGYLINIENEIMPEQLHNLQLFLRLLTEMMRTSATFSRVLWYDSVTATGKLSWQNKLNELNRIWYDNCDGIYLNYGWDDEMLLSSADFGALNRIFVGIDVFARGCIGGWDCYRSFAKANLMRMSIALFAPGWISEKFPAADPIEYGLRFWKKLALYTPARPILQLSVSTDFCAGFTRDAEGYRFRLDSISLQPHFSQSLTQPIPLKNGGVLLQKGSCTRLFCFDVPCSGCRITAHASRNVKLIVNDTVRDGTRNGTLFTVIIHGAFHLRSLHVCIDNMSDCQLFDITVEEIFNEQ